MSQFFYQISAADAVRKLGTDAQKGLSSGKARDLLKKHGPNKLAEGKKRPVIFKLFDQFKDLLIIVLIVAAGLAYYLDDFRGGTILLTIVVVNAFIGFYQEYKADKILESLKKIVKGRAIVIRDGQRKEIDEEELVPGDLVYLEEGGSVPADVRLLETTRFSTNDFVLTGESVPQEKDAKLVFDKVTTVTNQDNCVFLGTTVATGNAYAVVFRTGMDTAIGRIARTTETIHHDESPLQKEINILAKTLTKIAGVIALSLFVINFFLNVDASDNLRMTVELSLLFAIGVAAASVPQGLPAQISVALSLGVGRLAKKKAVVKKLSSVETLGSTTVICSDKTGTITQNEMTITHAYINGRSLEVTGHGYNPKGEIQENGKALKYRDLEPIKQFFQDGFLASNGSAHKPDKEHDSWYALGDSTEAAFTPFAIKAGLDPDALERKYKVVHELPFDSDRKRMTIIREHKGKHIAYMKGGLTAVLDACDISEKEKKKLKEEVKSYSTRALRVIALAYRDLDVNDNNYSVEKTEHSFTFAGFVAMIDPAKPGVKEAIQRAYDAQIRVMMITGDGPTTAKAIAESIGMKDGPELTVKTGDEIKQMTDDKLKKLMRQQSVVFSRVSPEDKYRLITLLKEMGEVVAVTGDGVNDTLSLKKSDIGVAMGKLGSEVAKEASEIVLLDDNFKTLTMAISEGRTIFKNLKKTIIASITSNNGELTAVLLGFIGMIFGLPAPITAVQILAIDLIGEMLPLTALTFDPPEKSVMNTAPRDLNEHIINKQSLRDLIFFGFWMGAAGFFSFVMVFKFGTGTLGSAQAAAYTGIILCQYVNILSRRTDRTIFTSYLFTNRKLWGSFLVSILAVLFIINVPSVGLWFGFEGMSLADWRYPILGALVFLFWHEAKKFRLRFDAA